MKSITIEFDLGMKLMFHEKSQRVVIITAVHECASVPYEEFEALCLAEHKRRKELEKTKGN